MNYHISWKSTYEKERIITDSITIKEKIYTLFEHYKNSRAPIVIISLNNTNSGCHNLNEDSA